MSSPLPIPSEVENISDPEGNRLFGAAFRASQVSSSESDSGTDGTLRNSELELDSDDVPQFDGDIESESNIDLESEANHVPEIIPDSQISDLDLDADPGSGPENYGTFHDMGRPEGEELEERELDHDEASALEAWKACGRMIMRKLSVNISIYKAFLLCLVAVLLYAQYAKLYHYLAATSSLTKEFGSNLNLTTGGYTPAFAAPETNPYRHPDTIDTFVHYSYRNHSNAACQISSLDLHLPFAPLCPNRQALLKAMSSGGRIGFDAPFLPQSCDMRWFTTEEICEIFGRFEKVIVVGDSMMRHVVGALNVLLRKDLGYGAVTGWNFGEEELEQCFCNKQFDVKACSVQGIFTTDSVRQNDPDSLACSQPIDLIIEMMLKFPLDPTEVARFQNLLAKDKPKKPYAFIFGHGLWNDLDLQATVNWLDGVLDATKQHASYLGDSLWPRLFVTPNAAGILKPDEWVTSQGDKALQIFEGGVHGQAELRGVEHLGTWNMSIQASKYDGVHLDLKGNLLKAMSVVNWLSMVDVQKW